MSGSPVEPAFEISDDILAQVMRLQAEVSRQAESLAEGLGSLLVCRRGCHDCCQDNLSVFPVEAEVILRHCEPLLTFDKPHAPGKCAFLDGDGACRIYPWRPYVCRTQGLPLRWLADDEKEQRGICALNADEFSRQSTELEALPAAKCWTIGEVESQLAGLQVRALGSFQETLPRINLRHLFRLPSIRL